MAHPPPYAHQQSVNARMQGQRAFMLALDAGTGKSRILIDDMARIARLNRDKQRPMPAFLVIAPSGVHDESWPHELRTWWPDDVPMAFHTYHSGEGVKARTARLQLTHGDHARARVAVLLMHYEAFSADSGALAAEAFLHAARMQQRVVGIMADEVHWIKTPKAARTKTITRLAHKYTHVRRGASGTLVGKGHEDLFAVYRFLDPTILPPTFTAFKSAYIIEKQMGGRYTKIVGYRNLDELYAKIEPITARVTRDECLTLPERQILDRLLPMTREQQRLQDELTRLTVAELQGGTITAPEAGTRLVRFEQLANGFVARDDDPLGDVTEVPTAKSAALADVLTSYGDAKVIVWARFRYDVTMIKRVCDETEQTYVTHDGSMSKDDRDAALTRWRDPAGPRVLIATMSTLGIGRTLNEATLAVFWALTFDRVVYEQTIARNYRAGQRQKTVVIRLLVKGGACETHRRVLRAKDGMQTPLDQLALLLTPPSTPEPHG